MLDIGCGIGRMARVVVSELKPPGSYDGVGSAAEYRFPCSDSSFDLAIATSVFTHLLPDAADRYLAETARVLAPGGRLFATWLLLGVDGRNSRSSKFGFSETAVPAAVADPDVPEAAVAYQQSWIRDRLHAHGLRLRDPIHYGTWTGGPGLTFQDVIIAERLAVTSIPR